MTFTSENNVRSNPTGGKSLGLKLCALAGVGMLAVTGLSACSDDSDTGSDKSGSSSKASDFDGDMTLDDAYNIYDTASKEGDIDEWCMMQTGSIEIEDYAGSNIRYLIPNPKHIDGDLVEDTAREGCAHAILVADKSNQQTGEAYMSMKYTFLTKDINNIDYVKEYAKKTYPDADIDAAFDELHNDGDKVFEHLDENAFNKAAELYKDGVTPALLEEALRTDNKDANGDVIVSGFLPYQLSADQYRKAFEEAHVDMSDFAAYVIEQKIDQQLRLARDEDKAREHYLDGNTPKNFYHSEPPAEWTDRLIDEFKFTEAEARDGGRYVLEYASGKEKRQPLLMVPYLFSKYVEGPDHKPVTYTNGDNGEKMEFTEEAYNKAEVVGDLEYWEQGFLPVGVPISESKKYSDEQLKKWQEDGTPLK